MGTSHSSVRRGRNEVRDFKLLRKRKLPSNVRGEANKRTSQGIIVKSHCHNDKFDHMLVSVNGPRSQWSIEVDRDKAKQPFKPTSTPALVKLTWWSVFLCIREITFSTSVECYRWRWIAVSCALNIALVTFFWQRQLVLNIMRDTYTRQVSSLQFDQVLLTLTRKSGKKAIQVPKSTHFK